MSLWKLAVLVTAAARAALACSCDPFPSQCKPFTRPDSRIETSPNSATFAGKVNLSYPSSYREFGDRQIAFALGHPDLRNTKGRLLTFNGLKQFLSGLWDGKASSSLVQQILATPEETQPARLTSLESYQALVSLQVTEPFSGVTKGATFELLSGLGGADCSVLFTPGEEYLVFAHKDLSGFWTTDFCAGTKPLREADDDLAGLRVLRDGGKPKPYLAGTVTDNTTASGRGQGLGGFPFRLITENGAREFTSTPHGTFLVQDIAPGKYRLEIVQPGWFFKDVSGATAKLSVTHGCNEFDLHLTQTPPAPK